MTSTYQAPMYACFSEQGEANLYDIQQIETLVEQGIEPIIFLDSCVCLHLVKVIDYGKAAKNVDFLKIEALKEYISQYKIKISPFFGLLELCMKNGEFDEGKFLDFKHRIDFFEGIPQKEFRRYKYDFHRDYFILRHPGKLISPFSAINPSLKNSYCALLKIRAIANGGLTKHTALKNIEVFLNWMVSELDITLGTEYKLALNIFGGNTQYRKMIGLDCKQADIKKKLNGTCWDIFHSKNATNSFRIFEMLQRNIFPFFMTSDANLFKIFRNFSLTLVKDGAGIYSSSFLLNSDFSFPHYGPEFVDNQNKKVMEIFVNRYDHVYEFDEGRVDELIRQLEIDNGLVDDNNRAKFR